MSIISNELIQNLTQDSYSYYPFPSVHDKKTCHARAGGQLSIKIIRYQHQATVACFAR